MCRYSRNGESASSEIRRSRYGPFRQTGDTAGMQNRIREIRKQKGMTLAAVAKGAGTIPQTVAKLEKGTMALSLDWMRHIASAMNVAPADLLADSDWPRDIQELVEAYRAVPDENRATALQIALSAFRTFTRRRGDAA